MIYHVSPNGCDHAAGTAEAPFQTINRAARLAAAGDTVVVHNGVYREWVDPKNGGRGPHDRITYTAAEGEHPVIKGSEIVTGWERVSGTVWKKVLPNTMFADFNPYSAVLGGDWFTDPANYPVHQGDVYINGVSMYEASSMEDLVNAPLRTSGYQANSATNDPVEPILHPELTVYRWFAEVDPNHTTIYGNFQNYDPNAELIEINVRECCFYPKQTGRNYITVQGFEMAHAACPFAPPTADQRAMLGVNWSLGWIIENNYLHDAKCSAISIGKEGSNGDNEFQRFHKKYSHFYQTEAVFRGLLAGWCKEKIGSHIIRNNVICDCGTNAVVGHMGCAFSRIEHNHIYNIAVKHEFYGWEIAGIKLHAAIDVILENNCIHNCTLGTWLDWQAQGARVTKNIYYDNDRDFMIEVTHGPCLVDNNIMLSNWNFVNQAQGTAFIHNLLGGTMHHVPEMKRQLPYHFAHSTQVLGIAPIFGGDDRILNNLILCKGTDPENSLRLISTTYSENSSPEEYAEQIKRGGYGFLSIPALPVWIQDNVYAKPFEISTLERNATVAEGLAAELEEADGCWYLRLTVPQAVTKIRCPHMSTERLGAPVYSEEPYENPDSTPIDLTCDLVYATRDNGHLPGPFAALEEGEQRILVWTAPEL